MQRSVFIECGAWEGVSSKFFRNTHPRGCDFEQFAFECNPVLVDKLQKESPWLTVLNRAVWINEDEIPMYMGSGKYTESSSLIKEKRTGKLDKDNPTMVKGIDFSQWIKDTFSPEDFICVKMNIEGAEYEVLNKMIEDGTLDYVHQFYIQWHWKKINLDRKIHDKLVSDLDDAGATIFHWNLDHSSKAKIGEFKEYFMDTI